MPDLGRDTELEMPRNHDRAPDQGWAAGTAAIGAVVHLLATAIEEGRDLSSMSGVLAGAAYRLLLA